MTSPSGSTASWDYRPPPEQQKVADALIDLVDRYGLHTPAILALEMSKPLNKVASTLLLLAAPSVQLMLATDSVQQLGLMLDDRRASEYLLRCLEERA